MVATARPAGAEAPGPGSSRLRVLVIQALVFSLFATLFARLYYLQVVAGDTYHARAASQSLRDIVVQPERGLIVDAQGRPLVANRTSWVVSVDRTLLGKLGDHGSGVVVERLADVLDMRPARILAKLVSCGDEGSEVGVCWNGSPYQPVPIAADVGKAVALRILEQPEDYPAVLAEQQSVRSYPQPFGINLAHVLGYLSPITSDEYDEAQEADDTSVNGASVVGRAGVEQQYDRWLRGMPGYRTVAVDSMGRVLGDDGEVAGQPGDTLVTSIDAKVQGVVERQLWETIRTARADPRRGDRPQLRGRLRRRGGARGQDRACGRDGQPADVRPRGLGRRDQQGPAQPALLRARPATRCSAARARVSSRPARRGSPSDAVSALNNGFTPDSRLDCSSGLQVGNRWFKNYESASYGYIDFAKALQISCDSFFYRVGLSFWSRYGSDPQDVDAKDPLVEGAKNFGFGKETGIDLPGEAGGRIADRHWKLAYWKSMKGYYCQIDRDNAELGAGAKRDFLHVFAHEFCLEGSYYRAGDAVNYSIGQGDTLVTPLQLARAYAALSNGGTLYEPRIGKAIVSPDGKVLKRIAPEVQGRVQATPATHAVRRQALLGTAKVGTMAWRMIDFPLDQVHIRSKTGSAEVYGKQSTSWVASYDENYVVVMMVSQAGTGSGTSGPAVRAIWEALYGITGSTVDPRRAAIPGTTPPEGLPTFLGDGSILPPGREAPG